MGCDVGVFLVPEASLLDNLRAAGAKNASPAPPGHLVAPYELLALSEPRIYHVSVTLITYDHSVKYDSFATMKWWPWLVEGDRGL